MESESGDISWIIDAVVTFCQSNEFRDKISAYLNSNCTEYCKANTPEELKITVYNGYVTMYNDLITKMFTEMGLPIEQIKPAWDYLLQSEEGASDTRMASEFLSAENISIFGGLMEYYNARHFLSSLRDSGSEKDVILQATSAAELAELQLAISLSTELEKRAKERESGKKVESKPIKLPPPPPPKPKATTPSSETASSSSVPSSSSKASKDDSDAFGVTGKQMTVGDGKKKLTPMTSSGIQSRLVKLREMEESLLQQLAKIREEQEKAVRERSSDLAAKMKAKREAALSAQKK
ncbi:uncharacterized protein MONOS_2157 [Monocercomonoides exilis]|uniref:uncharacterized protein n=1 Tax=Monocercomonoides exilis TaxID=2049356 RepID=UPI00355AB17F|nr:hypothetical protein MONOS_2157 [Monocercomonoides exilis]|eukprot:MONOS_2157.1-p1 / transcript=MONOS_2157.1 / gene=MONOS_2157 / organism=Monocercomonoides_exilis_PA203 / gene_product=unspecified product / transcript_product=unspecified product / location=Mono_scaffold00042:174872-176000(+) / protein_length=293 / sequence_SO=supercontig / SO=protein_coding / is_pseudo=false